MTDWSTVEANMPESARAQVAAAELPRLTFGSLYSCIGGSDLGLSWLGWECRWQVELDPARRSFLGHWWPSALQFTDVRYVDRGTLPAVDFVYAEPQVTSVVDGQQCTRAVLCAAPQFAIVDVATGHDVSVYESIADELLTGGYSVDARVVQYATSAVVHGSWRVVASEPRSRAVFLAHRAKSPSLVEASDFTVLLNGPATRAEVLAANEDALLTSDLEVARGFDRGWTNSLHDDRRHSALRDASSPFLAAYLARELVLS